MIPVRLAFVVDYEGRAWDIAARECLAHGSFAGDVITQSKLRNKPDMTRYDHVLVYPWNDPEVMPLLADVRDRCILCVAAGDLTSPKNIETFRSVSTGIEAIGANNRRILEAYQSEFPDIPVILLSHGVDTDLFTPHRIPSETFRIGWVGRPSYPIKRLDMAQRIVLSMHGSSLYVAGFYGEFEFPYYSHDQMPSFYDRVDCLLVTSSFEAHPLCVYEAMAMETPVICTDVGDVSEYIVQGMNGYIVRSDRDLERRLVLVLESVRTRKDVRDNIGRAARATVVQRLRWDVIIEQYEAIAELHSLRK